mgnify:CR=1 FL=1
MDIGITIKELRKEKGLSQGDLASKIGITGPSLSQIETGNSKPKKSTLSKICDELQITPELLYLLSLSEENVVEGKQNLYKSIYPQVREWMKEIFYDDDKSIVKD